VSKLFLKYGVFQVTKQTISEHLINVFETKEVDENSVVRKFLTTVSDGKNYNTLFYSLDAVISVGYRVNSKRATEFRQWATRVLKEFYVKGFVLDRKRLPLNSILLSVGFCSSCFGKIDSSNAFFWLVPLLRLSLRLIFCFFIVEFIER
jgi:hypothetical protein